jgi:hypothetical protein
VAGLDSIVAITITTETAQVTQAGFGTPLVLSAHTKNTDRIRRYTDLAGLVADGFVATNPEYLAIAAIFAQNPRPTSVALGRRALQPTMKATLTPTASNSATYVVTIDGVAYSFTADSSATAAEVVAGLTALVNADGACAVTASGSTTLVLTADAPGVAFRLAVNSTDLLSIAVDNVDPGVATDLAAIALVDNDWYALVSLFKSALEVAAIAAWAESNDKIFIVALQDTGVIGSGTADIASTLKTSAYARTAPLYHPANGTFADAALAGKCLPFDPGSETWAFKTLAGVAAVALTATQQANLKTKRVTAYVTIGGVNITVDGKVSANEYIDVIRFRDWLKARMQERIFTLLANAKKIPFSDAGAALLEAEVRAQLREGVDVGGLDGNPAPTTSVPRIADVSTINRAARHLPGVAFTGKLAGAVHDLAIAGTITA